MSVFWGGQPYLFKGCVCLKGCLSWHYSQRYGQEENLRRCSNGLGATLCSLDRLVASNSTLLKGIADSVCCVTGAQLLSQRRAGVLERNLYLFVRVCWSVPPPSPRSEAPRLKYANFEWKHRAHNISHSRTPIAGCTCDRYICMYVCTSKSERR